MQLVVTGTAGFIGFHTALRLLERGDAVVGVDCLTDYYDVRLKEARLERLRCYPAFEEARVSVADKASLKNVFSRVKPSVVVHLAAQAGVRYSVENPDVYGESNLVGFLNMLECCREHSVAHLVYASTSSVYGANPEMPFCESDGTAHPMSLYAATKKANEVMAHAYSHLFALPATGLRFFTVYGPWGRPDMALFRFTKAILQGQPIDVYNHGDMKRDFTYVDDIVEGILRTLDHPPVPDMNWTASGSRTPYPGASAVAPFRIYNIGRGAPVSLMDFIQTLEECLGRKAVLNLMPMQAGDVSATFADISALRRDTGYSPLTPVSVGVERFVAWYRDYYGI
ncbi:NAD-dependent epimerase [Haematospirillum sp. H1815]|uniref:NAD-dependent epimerase n=1 Tax=Haematospirillum sp. H1815 TaxID=2723108 RepID=UPI00143A41A3|nr:NAD-dependent epimerase [Haematospirillum sp. H1815]NKD77588.1 NAD-dependent epimerase [Haematospirillum sp. H1815]